MTGPLGRLFRDILIYGTGDILLRATAFITLPIYTRLFTPEEYGVLGLIGTINGLWGAVLELGASSAYVRYFFEAKSVRERQVITSTLLAFLAGWGGASLSIAWLASSRLSEWSFGNDQYATLFALSLIAVPLALVNQLCAQVLRNQFRATYFTVLNVISSLLTVGLTLFAVLILRLGLAGLLWGPLISTLLMVPVRLWTVRALIRPAFSYQVLSRLLKFGVPLVPMSLAYWVFVSSDRIVLGKLSTLEEVGLYGVANNLTSVLGFVNGALGQAWTPHAVKAYEEHPASAAVLFGRVMTYILVGFGLLSVGITAYAPEMLLVLTRPAFYRAAVAVAPLALSFVAYGSTQVTAIGFSIQKNTHYLAIFAWLAAVLNVGLNLLFVPAWGMLAAAWSTTAAYVFLTVVYGMFSQRYWQVAYEWRPILVTVALTFVFTVGGSFLPAMSLAIGLVVKGLYCLLYLALLAALRVLGWKEWQALPFVQRRKASDNWER